MSQFLEKYIINKVARYALKSRRFEITGVKYECIGGEEELIERKWVMFDWIRDEQGKDYRISRERLISKLLNNEPK